MTLTMILARRVLTGLPRLAVVAALVGGARGVTPSLVSAGGAPAQQVPGSFVVATGTRPLGAVALSGATVLWVGYTKGVYATANSGAIYARNLVTGRTVQVTPGGLTPLTLATDGATVVWTDCRSCSSTAGPDAVYPLNSTIYGASLRTGHVFPVALHPGTQRSPAVSGSVVVWTDEQAGRVYAKNLTTGQKLALSPRHARQATPAISGTLVVWQERSASGSAIYGKDLATGRAFLVASRHGDQETVQDPRISGHTVVWTDWYNGAAGYPARLWSADLTTGRQTEIAALPYGVYNPQFGPPTAVGDRLVIWQTFHTPTTWDSFDIAGKDLVTGRTFYITRARRGLGLAAVAGRSVVWQEMDRGTFSIQGVVVAP